MKKNNTFFKTLAKRVFAFALVFFLFLVSFAFIDYAKINFGFFANPFSINASAAQISSGNGTWISGKLTYSYSVATAGVGTSTNGATGSVSASGSSLTVKATSAKAYSESSGSGCNSSTKEYSADSTTTEVTVTNTSSYPLKFTKLTTTGDAIVTGLSQGQIVASGSSFTIKVTSPADGNNATEKTGTVTVAVEEQQPHEVEITFLAPATIQGNVPGSYTISGGGQSYSIGTISSTNMTSFTLTASANSGFIFVGWFVDGVKVSSNTTYSSSFANDTNTVQPLFDISGADPLAQIAELNCDDPMVSKYDVAEYY